MRITDNGHGVGARTPQMATKHTIPNSQLATRPLTTHTRTHTVSPCASQLLAGRLQAHHYDAMPGTAGMLREWMETTMLQISRAKCSTHTHMCCGCQCRSTNRLSPQAVAHAASQQQRPGAWINPMHWLWRTETVTPALGLCLEPCPAPRTLPCKTPATLTRKQPCKTCCLENQTQKRDPEFV